MELRYLCLLILWLAAPLMCKGEPLDLVRPPAEWLPLFEQLQVKQPMQVEFTELRRNPFHRVARRFIGTVRWDPALGLSIQYREPTEMVMRISEQGLVVIRGGKAVQAELGRDQEELLLLFARIFAWDAGWLQQRFEVDGELQPAGDWRLDMRVVSDALKGSLWSLVLEGELGKLRGIGLSLSGGRTVRMRMEEARFIEAFCPEILAEAFPSIDE